MAVTSPPSITALPDAPDPNNRTTFNALAYPWSVALDTFGTEVAALGANVYANATDAAASATSASASSTSAIAAANFKGAWSGLTGALAIPASVSHSGGLWLLLASVADVTAHTPGVSANWMRLGQVTMPRRTITGGSDPLVAGDLGGFVDITSGTFTLSYTAAATLGAGFWCVIRNSGSGVVTHDPNSAETIDGSSTLAQYQGSVWLVHSDGSNIRTIVLREANGVYHLQDQRTSGTDGSSISSTTWTKRTFQTEVKNTISGASLSSSVITLPAGSYRINATAAGVLAANAGVNKLRLRNTSDGSTTLTGVNSYLTGNAGSAPMILRGEFTITASKNFELQHYITGTGGSAGAAASSGEIEVHADVFIERIS